MRIVNPGVWYDDFLLDQVFNPTAWFTEYHFGIHATKLAEWSVILGAAINLVMTAALIEEDPTLALLILLWLCGNSALYYNTKDQTKKFGKATKNGLNVRRVTEFRIRLLTQTAVLVFILPLAWVTSQLPVRILWFGYFETSALFMAILWGVVMMFSLVVPWYFQACDELPPGYRQEAKAMAPT